MLHPFSKCLSLPPKDETARLCLMVDHDGNRTRIIRASTIGSTRKDSPTSCVHQNILPAYPSNLVKLHGILWLFRLPADSTNGSSEAIACQNGGLFNRKTA